MRRLLEREDERPDPVQVRLQAYERRIAPLIEFDRDLGMLERMDVRRLKP